MVKKLWGGRFKKAINKDFFRFQRSVHYDHRLAEYDIIHSMIHVLALKNAGILSVNESKKLYSGLKALLKDARGRRFRPNPDSEDIHTDIQNKMEKKVGKLALKLHTLRSRNDQIVFDERNYCVSEAARVAELLSEVSSSLKTFGNKYGNFFITGYTHTQRAQKIPFENYPAAFIHMFLKDRERLLEFKKRTAVYIGSGAFKGTTLTKSYIKAIKEFLKTKEHISARVSVAASPAANVSDRDFIIEFLSILSILQMHLSRLAEDFILYSTKEFDYFDLPEEFCTGSSLMPHKKNPDFLELVRGYTGRIYGSLISLLTMMKGLPLTYNRDMQLDKEPLLASVDIIKDELKILAVFIKGIKLNKEAINGALADEGLCAVEIAEYLVSRKVPFKQAHDITGRLIRYSLDKGCKIKHMADPALKRFSPYLNKRIINKILK